MDEVFFSSPRREEGANRDSQPTSNAGIGKKTRRVEKHFREAAGISRYSKNSEYVICKAGALDAVGPLDASHLLVAWLKDALPSGVENLVWITAAPAATEMQGESASNLSEDRCNGRVLPSGIGAELAERLIFFGKLAVLNPDIRKIVDVCYDAAQRAEISLEA